MRSRLGRRKWAWWLIVVLLAPIFLCGVSLLVYMVFPPSQINILLMGLDSRPGDGFLARSDSIMLIGIDPARLNVSVLSFPRDLFIEVPDYGRQRINAINVLAEMKEPGTGPDLLATSLEQDFDVQIDHYIRLNFDMFVELIDAVGGVTIDVEHVIIDNAYPTKDGGMIRVRFESGVQHMDGERALIYARTRHGSDDFRRAEHQQQVVSAWASKMTNPVYWPAVLSILNRYVDTDLTLWDLLRIAPPLVLNRGRFDLFVITKDYILGTKEGHAIPNYDLIMPWVKEHLG